MFVGIVTNGLAGCMKVGCPNASMFRSIFLLSLDSSMDNVYIISTKKSINQSTNQPINQSISYHNIYIPTITNSKGS